MTITNDYIAQQILEGVTVNRADVVRMRNDGRTDIPINLAIGLADMSVLLAEQLVAEREKTRALTAILREGGAL